MAGDETEGISNFKVGHDIYQTWYKIVGDLENSSHRPLVALHGGPGMSHHYMLPHANLFKDFGIPVVFYDQIGNGQSSHVRDAPVDFWTPKLFADQLDSLLKDLNIYDNFDLIGQSWGGMLAGYYAADRTPKGLNLLIIANAPASVPSYAAGTNFLLEQFPSDFVKMLRDHEHNGTTSSLEYQEGVMQFSKKHVCTTNPWPEDLIYSFKSIEQNPTVYNTMFGESEFNITGTLKNFSIVDILHKIPYSTLLISSPSDSVQGPAFLPFYQNITKVKWVEIITSTHLAMFEDPERYFNIIKLFLDAHE